MPFQDEVDPTQLHWILAIWISGLILPDLLILFSRIWKPRFSCVIFCFLNVESTFLLILWHKLNIESSPKMLVFKLI